MQLLTRLSLDHPRSALLLLLLVTVLLGSGLPKVRTEFGYRVLVGDNHPSIVALDSMLTQFGGGMPLQILWDCRDSSYCESVFDPASLLMASKITTALQAVEGIRRVSGPANAPLLVPASDGFRVRRLVEDGLVADDIKRLAARALNDPHWRNQVISADGQSGIVVVQTADTRSATNVRVVDEIDAVLAEFREQGRTFYLAGDPIGTVISGRDLATSSSRLVPFTVIVIGAVVLFLSGSLLQAAAALATMGLALLWTFGVLGLLGWPQDGILEVLAPFVLVVGVCDAMHVLSRQSSELRHGCSPREAVLRAVEDVGPACVLTTLTTALALLSFATSALETFVRFGVISAIGSGSCLLLTFTLLPVLVSRVPRTNHPGRSRLWDAGMTSVARASKRHAHWVLGSSGLLLLVFAHLWMTHLQVDTDWYESFGRDSTVMKWVERIESRIGPRDSLELVVGLPVDAPVEDPQTLDLLARLERELVTAGYSVEPGVVSLIQRMNRILHDDNVDFETVGPSRTANAELIEMLSLEDDVLSPWLNIDRSKVRIPVFVPEQSYSADQQAIGEVTQLVGRILPENWNVTMSGEVEMTASWIDAVHATQLRSFPAAATLVLMVVTAFFRSVRLGLASLLPTMVPVVLTLGAMGLLGMSLDVGRAMIAAVLIGIGVDDAVHVLVQYDAARRSGENPSHSIELALRHSGRAIVTTSVALALGFLTLMASAWQTISSFGFFVALAIVGALVSTLFVLPALVVAFSGDGGRE